MEISREPGVDPMNLEEVAADLQKRKQTVDLTQRRSMTDYFQATQPEDAGEGGKAGISETPKGKERGRAPGSKNKNTIEREAREAEKATRQEAGKFVHEKKHKKRKSIPASKESKSI